MATPESQTVPLSVRVHLIYQAFVLLAGTVTAVAGYAGPTAPLLNMALWLGGVFALAIYMGFIIAYARTPRSTIGAIVMIADGPLFVLAAAVTGTSWSVVNMLGQDCLVDGLGIVLGILALVFTPDSPAEGHRLGSVLVLTPALLAFGGLVGVPVWRVSQGDWVTLGLVGGGILWTAAVTARLGWRGRTSGFGGSGFGNALILGTLLAFHLTLATTVALRVNHVLKPQKNPRRHQLLLAEPKTRSHAGERPNHLDDYWHLDADPGQQVRITVVFEGAEDGLRLKAYDQAGRSVEHPLQVHGRTSPLVLDARVPQEGRLELSLEWLGAMPRRYTIECDPAPPDAGD